MSCLLKNIPFNASIAKGNKGNKFPVNPVSCINPPEFESDECYFIIEGISDTDEFPIVTPEETPLGTKCS